MLTNARFHCPHLFGSPWIHLAFQIAGGLQKAMKSLLVVRHARNSGKKTSIMTTWDIRELEKVSTKGLFLGQKDYLCSLLGAKPDSAAWHQAACLPYLGNGRCCKGKVHVCLPCHTALGP
jgi:hypothetical protein